MSPLGTSNILYEAAELLAQSNQDLIFVLDRLYNSEQRLDGWNGWEEKNKVTEKQATDHRGKG